MSKQYFLNRQVIIMPYDDNWPKIFTAEKTKIQTVIADESVIIEHIGSTAIPGLAAKPVIDIMVGIKDLATTKAYIKALENIGYEYIQEFETNLPKRRFLHRKSDSSNQHFHLHITETGSVFWQNQLFFRDYMLSNQKAVEKYQTLKEKSAETFRNDPPSYTEAKNDFIQTILNKNPSQQNERMVNGKKIRLWTETFGNKNSPAILLIAGAQAPSIFWPDFFCKLLATAGFFVIRYDHRDIGYSTHFPTIKDLSKPIYNLDDLVNDALLILNNYKIAAANIIGHSMGGNIAQYLAAFHGNRVLKVVSMSVAAEKPTHQHANYQEVMAKLLKNKPNGNFEQDWTSGWKRSLQLLNDSHYSFDSAMAKNYVKTIYKRHEDDFNPAWNQIAAQQNKANLLSKLPQGMLFINGTEDIFSPDEDIKNLPNKFKIQILKGAGHMFFNTKLWNIIAKTILNYLRTN